ncbi:TaqI-like C-terminal specificity domain-containing protein [Treponema socranskii]|uniref:TaqI-like C-terminal specificity domain-containing protein n=1 Tax=Treponema socranskii TaxID=53419 RepID=UPI0023F0C110|nr:TaqI-like C-terminal specificity domain-containing protein [Treponema socranskii]
MKQNSCASNFNSSSAWVILSPIEQSIKSKIEKAGTPLRDWNINIYRGVLTGFNDAFIISGEKRQEILDNCKSEDERKRTDDLIRPILRGRDIKRYEYNFADLYLINTHNGVKEKNIPRIAIEDYPTVKAHLDEYWEKIEKRADQGDTPYNLRNCAYMDEFNKPRIIYCEIGIEMDACLVESGYFINNKLYMISGENLPYLLLFLNSKIFNKIILQTANLTGGKGVDFMNKIHLIKPTRLQIEKAEKILYADIHQQEDFINSLYNFTEKELRYINSL